jgi:hypothetical protein
VALVVAALPSLRADRAALQGDLRVVRLESELYDDLPRLVAAAGGRDAVLRCRPIYASAFEQEAVAWALHVHSEDVRIVPAPPGTAIAGHGAALARDPRFHRTVESRRWVLARNCRAPAG